MKKIIRNILLCVLVTAIVLTLGVKQETFAAKANNTIHTVTFMYGTKVFAEPVYHGKDAVAPLDTAVAGYTFTGWVGNLKKVTEDRIIVGSYVPGTAAVVSATPGTIPVTQVVQTPAYVEPVRSTYEVNFYDGVNGSHYYHQTVSAGAYADPPSPPSHDGYHFSYYDGSYTNVTSDRRITACYEKDKPKKKEYEIVEIYVYPEDDFEEIVYYDEDDDYYYYYE